MNSVRSSLNPRIADPAAKIVQGNNEFALDLYSHLARSGASNLFFSPFGISSVLAMTFAGARGRTEHEMGKTLHFAPDQEDLHPGFAGLNKTIFAGENHGYKISIANRLWGRRGYELRPEFLELLRREYGADLCHGLDPICAEKGRRSQRRLRRRTSILIQDCWAEK